ncbi:hypothetical protein [Rhizorhabdus argentea]|uniref:hypothetical protein n=1 Tax=Rhizorhabdus argentea TaxID=1387174 RepID=UPI0030EF5C90
MKVLLRMFARIARVDDDIVGCNPLDDMKRNRRKVLGRFERTARGLQLLGGRLDAFKYGHDLSPELEPIRLEDGGEQSEGTAQPSSSALFGVGMMARAALWPGGRCYLLEATHRVT